MDTNNDFNLKTFQSEVFEDFKAIKATMSFALLHSKGYKSNPHFEDNLDLSFSPIGLFTRGFLTLFSFLGKKAKKNHLTKPEFIEKEKEAARIAYNPKVKKILCRALRKKITPDSIKEVKQVRIINIVTTLLTKEKIAEELSIEKDVRLFSLIAFKIYRMGVTNYCN